MLSECSDPSLGAQCATWSFTLTICHQWGGSHEL